jgi:hypothetical protein
MSEQRFPYERSRWSGDERQLRQWYEALNRMSPEDVRARLAQVDAGSPGAISIGSEMTMTKGFAEEWLAWKDKRKIEREDRFRHTQVFWTRWAAVAASIAAAAAAIGWAITVWRKW